MEEVKSSGRTDDFRFEEFVGFATGWTASCHPLKNQQTTGFSRVVIQFSPNPREHLRFIHTTGFSRVVIEFQPLF